MNASKAKGKSPRKCMRWCLGFPLFLLLCGFIWAWVGIPGGMITGLLASRLPYGFMLETSEVRFRPGEGFRFSNFELYSARDRVTPLFEAEEVVLDPAFLRRLREPSWSAVLRIRSGRLETNLGTWADDLITDRMLRIRNIHGQVILTPDELRFLEFGGSLQNMDLQISGGISRTDGEDGETPEPFQPAYAAKVVAEVLTFLEGFQFEESPLVEVNLHPGSGGPSEGNGGRGGKVTLSLRHSGPSLHRGFAFRELEVRANYENRLLTVEEFLVRENPERVLSGKAKVDFGQNVFEVEMQNTLRRFGMEALAPFSIGKMLDGMQLRLEDRCDFTLKIGPNSFERPEKKIKGTFRVENGFYRDAFFPEVSLTLDLDLPRLKLSQVEGRVGQGKGEGPFSGTVEMDFVSGFQHVDLEGAFYPDFAVSLVGPVAEKYLREWEFRGPPPSFGVRVDMEETGAPLHLRMEVDGREVLWRGTSFDHIATEVTYEDGKLSILNARASRGPEEFEGNFRFGERFRNCRFDLQSRFHLPDILQLIGPGISKWAQPFRFRGKSSLQASGFIDFADPPAHDFTGEFEFEDLVWQWLSLNQISGSVRVKDQVLVIPDLNAKLEGGSLDANFRSERTFAEDGRFALAMQLKNMDLYKVITKATDLEDTPYKGNLSLNLNLTGNLKDTEAQPRSDTFTGKGNVEIREGALFRIPLLLGLSEILSKLVKGFGYASQSDFTADFAVGDGHITSPELFLQGNVISIAGPGSYRFADRKISADLKIHLLKEGVISDALKLILWPIRKLVEVQLTGTLDNPDWQPKNLPKELFGK